MMDQLRDLRLLVSRIDRQHIRILIVLLSLILFVLGAGAPADDGGWAG